MAHGIPHPALPLPFAPMAAEHRHSLFAWTKAAGPSHAHEAQPCCQGRSSAPTQHPSPSPTALFSTALHPKNGARAGHLPLHPLAPVTDPPALSSLPVPPLAWEDEDEEGADAPDELDDFADVGDEEGDGQRGSHPGDRQGHPAAPLLSLRHCHGPALRACPQVLHHRSDREDCGG